jgi:hypothetical protein
MRCYPKSQRKKFKIFFWHLFFSPLLLLNKMYQNAFSKTLASSEGCYKLISNLKYSSINKRIYQFHFSNKICLHKSWTLKDLEQWPHRETYDFVNFLQFFPVYRITTHSSILQKLVESSCFMQKFFSSIYEPFDEDISRFTLQKPISGRGDKNILYHYATYYVLCYSSILTTC